MKFTYNRLNALLFSLFIIGTMAVAYLLFNFPGALERTSIRIDNKVLDDIRPLLWKINLVTIVTLLLGLATMLITVFINNANTARDNVVYNEKAEADLSAPGDTKEVQQEEQGVALQQIREMLVGEKDMQIKADKWLSGICNKIEASQAVLYIVNRQQKETIIELHSAYAFAANESERIRYEMGEGLVGQVAKSAKKLYVDDVPEDYIKIISGLGSGSPRYLLLVPIIEGKDVLAIAEIASFTEINEEQVALVEKAFELLRKDFLAVLKGSEVEKKKQNRNSNSKTSK